MSTGAFVFAQRYITTTCATVGVCLTHHLNEFDLIHGTYRLQSFFAFGNVAKWAVNGSLSEQRCHVDMEEGEGFSRHLHCWVMCTASWRRMMDRWLEVGGGGGWGGGCTVFVFSDKADLCARLFCMLWSMCISSIWNIFWIWQMC